MDPESISRLTTPLKTATAPSRCALARNSSATGSSDAGLNIGVASMMRRRNAPSEARERDGALPIARLAVDSDGISTKHGPHLACNDESIRSGAPMGLHSATRKRQLLRDYSSRSSCTALLNQAGSAFRAQEASPTRGRGRECIFERVAYPTALPTRKKG